jgi:hypothetical protein
MDPLGPLGDSFTPSTHQEEALLSPPVAQAQGPAPVVSSSASLKTLRGSVNIDEDDELPSSSKARVPPPVQPPAPDSPLRQTQPSVSIVEAAKPSFHIIVGDPHKVGDLTTAHTEYQVTTKVCGKHGNFEHISDYSRLLQRHTVTQNSQYRVDSEISYGFTINCIVTIPVLSSLHLQKNRQ